MRIGLDVGGTFTDCVLLSPDGTFVLEKTPTTPDDQSEGVLAGIARLAEAGGFAAAADLLAATTSIVHGTTTGDNTMIQMSGAATGLLVTTGFRDEIEFRRCYKEDIWDPAYPAPTPIARRRVRLEIPERVTAEGEIETPLDEAAVRHATRRLQKLGVRSIAVAFLHSYLNPAHERRARELILEEFPDVDLVSLSHEVYPKPPEFERTSTTLVNAYVGPPDRALPRPAPGAAPRFRVHARAADRDVGRWCRDSLGDREPGRRHDRFGAHRWCRCRGARRPRPGWATSCRSTWAVRATTCASSATGVPELRSDWNWRHRYCIALPMVDIASIGAGGGSIARVDEGILHVGPESAGSQPGPVCYSRGGTKPTVTDADLVLGRLDAAAFWGGRLRLDEAAARRALEAVGQNDRPRRRGDRGGRRRARRRAHDRRGAAGPFLAGADPRRLDLVAFGGMGAVHATTQAAALGMQQVLVPRAAPGFSALGLLTADHVVDATRTLLSSWADVDIARLNVLADELESAARAELSAAGVPESRLRFEWMLNLVYPGQTFDRAMPLARHDGSRLDADAVKAAVDEFHRRNEEARLIEARAQEPTMRGVRLIATGVVDRPEPLVLAEAALPEPTARRRLFVSDAWCHAPVYDAAALAPGPELTGPAIVQSRFTALVLRPGDRARVLTNGDTLVAVAP